TAVKPKRKPKPQKESENELAHTLAQKEILKTAQEKDASVVRDTTAVKPKRKPKPQKESENELAHTLARKEILKTVPEKDASVVRDTTAVKPKRNLKPKKELAHTLARKEIVKTRQEKDSSVVKDTTAVKPKGNLEPQKESEEEEEATDIIPDEWAVSVHAGPFYYGYLSNGYPILEANADVKRANDLSVAYGVLLNTRINSKMVFRSGINLLKLKYTLSGVTSTIDALGRPAILDNQKIESLNPSIDPRVRDDINAGLPFDIRHKITYWEIPFEVLYNVKTGPIGIDIIGGLNIHIFNDDTISLKVPGTGTFDIAQTNHFKTLAGAAHIGVGFRYMITDHIQLDMEPTFKYQFGSFEGDVGNFNPYYFGIYTGFTFK
ncbi:MAG: hypothetical protein WBG90_04130, partial [Saonia sp.]